MRGSSIASSQAYPMVNSTPSLSAPKDVTIALTGFRTFMPSSVMWHMSMNNTCDISQDRCAEPQQSTDPAVTPSFMYQQCMHPLRTIMMCPNTSLQV